jgi:CHASE3 domain sensor protein
MDTQTVINSLMTALGALGGYVLKGVRDSVKDLQVGDKALADKVQSIELLVAGQYVRRSDMDKLADALFHKLDRIEEKLDAKADRA